MKKRKNTKRKLNGFQLKQQRQSKIQNKLKDMRVGDVLETINNSQGELFQNTNRIKWDSHKKGHIKYETRQVPDEDEDNEDNDETSHHSMHHGHGHGRPRGGDHGNHNEHGNEHHGPHGEHGSHGSHGGPKEMMRSIRQRQKGL